MKSPVVTSCRTFYVGTKNNIVILCCYTLPGNSEWKRLMHGPPSYMHLLEIIFEGVAVDGSTSYVAGQANMDYNRGNAESDEAYEIPEYESPMSSGSH